MRQDVILLHRDAPPKPPVGQPCNGCGACCAWRPCPLGMLASRRRAGPCRALRWDEAQSCYRCGLLDGPGWRRRLVARWIGAGRGCDAALETQRVAGGGH